MKSSAYPRLVFSVLSLVLALPLVPSARAQPAEPTEEPRALGLRPPTPEETQRLRALAPRVVRVLPNARALGRVNDERLARSLAPLTIPLVPEGREIELESDAPASRSRETPDNTPPADASAPGGFTIAAETTLPSAADNSTLAAFPPVRSQGQIGSCACFSSVYYMSTFMVAQARGLNVRNAGDTDKLSPKFVYPMVNGGSDSGSWFTNIFEVLLKHGAPTWSNWPYSGTNTPSSYLEWPVTSALWRGALANRMASSYQLTDIDTDAGLTRLKTSLANGAIVVFASNINGWDFTTLSDDTTTPDDNAFVGRPVCKVIRIHDSGHAMTIVGYNDNLWVDLNKNGRVDPGEKGALRIVNSWGNGWQDGGFVWVAYDALRVTSAVSGVGTDITQSRAGTGNTSLGARKPFWDSTTYGLTARASYTPQLLAEVTLKGVRARNELSIGLGRGGDTATSPSSSLTPGALQRQGGYYSFIGTSTASDGTFVFDLTDLRQSGSNRYFVTVRDSAQGDSATFDSLRLLDSQGNALASNATGTPATVDASVATAYLTYNTTEAAPSITSPLSAAGTVNAAFTYVITATNVPTSFNATNLPAGLTINTSTGAIGGTPVAAGATNVTISATNSSGTDNRTLVLSIAAAVAPPVISSATTASGTSGAAFSYQITATNSPTSYAVTGSLPNGLSLNTATGLISGTPAQTGTFNLQVQALNAGGTGSRAVAITIAAPVIPVPVITSALAANIDAGSLLNYRITASNSPTEFGAQNLPSGLTVDSATGAITGRVSLARTYQITLTALNTTGTGYATLILDVRGNSSFAPANDNFSARIALNGASVATTGSNVSATAESGEPAHAGSPAATSVWWSWIAPSSGTLTLSTSGSATTMRSALYTGSSVATLTAIAPTGGGANTYAVTAGTTYAIAVDSLANNAGSIALALTLSAPPVSRPANDNFASAIVLSGTSASATALTTAATAEPGEPAHVSGNPTTKSIWYRWVAPATGRCNVNTRGSDFDTVLAVYTGAGVSALAPIARDDDSGGNGTSDLTFAAISGTTYSIAVDGYGGASGNTAINLTFAAGAATPANDNFSNATVLVGTTATASGTTLGASRETSEPPHAGNYASRSVWFRWIATANGLAQLSTAGSTFDTVLAVYLGSALPSLQPIASDDDSGGGSTSLLTFTAVAGNTYYFAVDGYGGESGNYALNLTLLSGAPSNNNFANAATLVAGTRVTALNLLATAETGEPAHAGSTASHSLWWRWTATATGFVTVTTAGSDFDTVLGVYTGTAVSTLTRVASNDDASFDDFTSTVFFRAVAGRTYYFAVDGYNGFLTSPTGTAALTLTVSANPNTVYATDFERFTTGAHQLVGQDNWTIFGGSSFTNSQGILSQGFSGQGRAAYVGFANPTFDGTSSNSLFVYRPLNFDPVTEGAPVVQVRVDLMIVPSTNGRNDVFRVALYNRSGTTLGGVYFDTATRRISTSDGLTVTASASTFSFNTRYTLLGTFNFSTRRWTARINATDLVTDTPFNANGAVADVGDIDFIWRVVDASGSPGDNFMIFDNFTVTADVAPATVPTIQLPAAAPSGSLGTAFSYTVNASNGPILSYSAVGLPQGLTLNTITGLVSGTPTQAGTYPVTFAATNARGQSSTSSATFVVLAGPPVITSAAATTVTLNRPFNHQITATNSPRRFGLRGTAALPPGVLLDPNTGVISGAPTVTGRYAVTLAAENDAGAGTATFEVIVDNPDFGRLINLSILAPLAPGETMTLGTVLGGPGASGAKPLLARAAGPALGQLGVAGFLPDPTMVLTRTSVSPAVVVDTNNDWGGSATLNNIFSSVGAFPYASSSSRDAALYQSALAAGNYTVQVRDAGSGSGTVIAELYDATPNGAFTSATPRLINVSVLKQIATNTSLTAGFFVGGSTSVKVLVRAVGPTLGAAPFNIAGAMADPKLEFFNNATGAKINENDDWGGAAALSATFSSVGAFQLANATTKDAALLVTLNPGPYSVRVSPASGSGGIVIVEIYEVP